MVGIAKKSSGKIRIFGFDTDLEWRTARSFIGLAPQEFNFDRYLSIRDVLIFQAGYYGLRGRPVCERADALLERFGLTSRARVEYTKISGGQKRRLTLARALIHEPRLLILDEPTAGVDVEQRLELWDLLRRLNGEGLTIFLTTHYLEEAEQLCRRIAIVRDGKIVTEEATHQLVRAGERLQDVFLELTRS
jgi:ABC-2 type transport system ATP-binding protein